VNRIVSFIFYEFNLKVGCWIRRLVALCMCAYISELCMSGLKSLLAFEKYCIVVIMYYGGTLDHTSSTGLAIAKKLSSALIKNLSDPNLLKLLSTAWYIIGTHPDQIRSVTTPPSFSASVSCPIISTTSKTVLIKMM